MFWFRLNTFFTRGFKIRAGKNRWGEAKSWHHSRNSKDNSKFCFYHFEEVWTAYWVGGGTFTTKMPNVLSENTATNCLFITYYKNTYIQYFSGNRSQKFASGSFALNGSMQFLIRTKLRFDAHIFLEKLS